MCLYVGPVKYRMLEEVTPESLREFVHSFMDGELTPHLSSERAPRETKGVPVKTLVGSTFSKIALDPEKNAVIKLCIPSVPDCEKASEFFHKVAKDYKGMKDVVFGEMNVALNDPPIGTKLDTLPAFYFSPKGSSEMELLSPPPEDDTDLKFYLNRRYKIVPKAKKGKKTQSKDEL